MRIATTLGLAAVGVLAIVLPCAAQSGTVSDAAKAGFMGSSVSKRPAPQRLAPPEEPAPISVQDGKPVQENNSVQEDVRAAPPPPAAAAPQQMAPRQVAPQKILPQQAYARPTFSSPAPPTVPAQQTAFSSPDRLLDWVTNYRKHPDLWNVPPAVHAMLDYGLFGDEEKQWFCIGFIAGILGANPKDGPALIVKMFPMPPKEQEVIVRAIVYSGRPDWRDLLEKNSERMPLRRPLIDDFLNGKRPALMDLPLHHGGSPGIYALWGYYVATGQHQPVMRIIEALQWSKNDEDSNFSFSKIFTGWGTDPSAVDKITTGGTAKWTLASYGERDRELIKLYRSEYSRQPPEIAKPLKEVIEAAELFEAEKIRKDQFGAIEDAQKRQLSAEAGMSKGMTASNLAIATGCVAATALGQAQIAIPCVIGGALFSGASKLAH
jgi:hypothetical protein